MTTGLCVHCRLTPRLWCEKPVTVVTGVVAIGVVILDCCSCCCWLLSKVMQVITEFCFVF